MMDTRYNVDREVWISKKCQVKGYFGVRDAPRFPRGEGGWFSEIGSGFLVET